jgi:hypothetical protein
LSSTPPSSALLLACQKLCGEAKGIYSEAYQRYWNKSFFIDIGGRPESIHHIVNLPVAHINTLTMKALVSGQPMEIMLTRVEGKWRAFAPNHDWCADVLLSLDLDVDLIMFNEVLDIRRQYSLLFCNLCDTTLTLEEVADEERKIDARTEVSTKKSSNKSTKGA